MKRREERKAGNRKLIKSSKKREEPRGGMGRGRSVGKLRDGKRKIANEII